MIFFQTSGSLIYVPLSCCVMWVKTIFTCSATREMFHSKSHTIIGHALFTTLNNRNHSVCNFTDQIDIFPKGTIRTLPSWICHGIHHVHITFAKSGRIPGTADTIRKFIYNMHSVTFYCRSNSHSSRPCRKHTGSIIHTENRLCKFITGIGCHTDRHKMFTLFCHCL